MCLTLYSVTRCSGDSRRQNLAKTGKIGVPKIGTHFFFLEVFYECSSICSCKIDNIPFISSLEVEAGQFSDSEILVMLGENGTGKTTFIRMMAGRLEPDSGSGDIPKLNISYKPQKISPKSQHSVVNLLHDKIRDAYIHPQFIADVMRPLKIDKLMDQEVQNLSGGELQRVAMALCLGKPADVYLIDEPSAYLDSEQRLVAAKVHLHT